MKSLRLLFALACLSVLAASHSWAEEQAKPADQPKEKPACTCGCCQAGTEHKECCCAKDCACHQAAKPETAKPTEPKPAEPKAN